MTEVIDTVLQGPGIGGAQSGRKIMAEKGLDQAPEVGEGGARAEVCPEAQRWEYTMHTQGVVDVKKCKSMKLKYSLTPYTKINSI